MELHALFRGRVQGVGFRWTVVDHAEKFRLTGTVKNLSNGSVEVYAYGDKRRLESFLEALQIDPGSACIDSVATTYRHVDASSDCFKIIN